MKKHKAIYMDKKFIESLDIDGWYVLDENEEFSKIEKVHKTIEYEVYVITTSSGKTLRCADNHILMDCLGNQIYSANSLNSFVKTKDGIERVVSVVKTKESENMYDLELSSETHTYFTNDILSHNTTTSVAYLLWLTLFHRTKSCALLANKAQMAKEILERYCTAYEMLPKWMQQGAVIWNKNRVKLENGSSVVAAATSSTSIRGNTYNCILLDEFAFVQPNVVDEFMRSVAPAISSGKTTQMIIISTPKGMNSFYKMWMDACNKKSGFEPFEINWYDVPGRDEEFKRQEIAKYGEEAFSQEYECNFLGSSDTLISGTKLKEIVIEDIKERKPIFEDHILDIYEHPKLEGKDEKEHIYFITVDVSEGRGLDYSALVVFDCSVVPYKVVAKYRSNTTPTIIFPAIVHEVAKYYDAYVLVEVNMNAQVADNLYYECNYEKLFKCSIGNKQPQNLCLEKPKNGHLGIKTSAYTKRIGCSNLKTLIEMKKLMVNDFEIFEELTTFCRYRESYAAEEGKNDDLVMCLVLFSWMTTQQLFKNIVNSDIEKRLKWEQLKYIQKDNSSYIGMPVVGNDELEYGMFVEGGCVWSNADIDESAFDYSHFINNY